MKLIVGLGNPGSQYENTRHNIGFMVIDRLSQELGVNVPVWDKDEKRNVLTCRMGDVILAKPQTFMNASGFAVKALSDFYQIAPDDVWVIHDDIDLPLGKIRMRVGGASAGHHGVDSIINHLKTDKFVRFRLGIGRGKESTGRYTDKNLHRSAVINFVVSRFRQSEAGEFKHLVKHGVEAVRISLEKGLERAMNRFN